MTEEHLGHGQTVHGFSSQEEMYEFLAQQRQASIDALQYTLPSQNQMTFGSYVFRAVHPDLPIFGRILTKEEIEDPEELAMTEDARTRGLIYGKWFSVVVPEGEYGSAHIIQCWPIRALDFQIAGASGWQLWPELHQRIQAEIEKERQEGEE